MIQQIQYCPSRALWKKGFEKKKRKKKEFILKFTQKISSGAMVNINQTACGSPLRFFDTHSIEGDTKTIFFMFLPIGFADFHRRHKHLFGSFHMRGT